MYVLLELGWIRPCSLPFQSSLFHKISCISNGFLFSAVQTALTAPLILSYKYFATAIHAFMTTIHVSYYSFQHGDKVVLLHCLQFVQNTAAWLLISLGDSGHISPALCSFHWLPKEWQIEFKMAQLIIKPMNGLGTGHICNLLSSLSLLGCYVPPNVSKVFTAISEGSNDVFVTLSSTKWRSPSGVLLCHLSSLPHQCFKL